MLGFAIVLTESGAPEQAAQLLGFVLHSPATPQMFKDQAQGLLQSLQEQLGPELLTETLERGKMLSLQEVNVILAQPLPTV